jgi:hypothetical protein
MKLSRNKLRKMILKEMNIGTGSGRYDTGGYNDSISNEAYLINQIVEMCEEESFKCDASGNVAVIDLPTGSTQGEGSTRLAIEVADDLSVEIELDLKDATIDKLHKLIYAIQSAI